MINQFFKQIPISRNLLRAVLQFFTTMILFCFLITFLPDSSAIDKTQFERFTEYLTILATLDFGYSTYYGDPIWEIVVDSGIKTLFLIFSAILFIILLAIPLSLYTAFNENRLFARWIKKSLFIISSIPILVVAIAIVALSVGFLGIMPEFNLFYDGDKIQKWIVLTLPVIAIILGDGILFSVFETLTEKIKKISKEPWIKGIQARGGDIKKHILRGVTETLIVSVSGKATFLISGIIVVELVFNWHGLGFVLLDIFSSTGQKDYPLLIAVMMLILLFVQFSGFIRTFTLVKMNPEKKISSGV